METEKVCVGVYRLPCESKIWERPTLAGRKSIKFIKIGRLSTGSLSELGQKSKGENASKLTSNPSRPVNDLPR